MKKIVLNKDLYFESKFYTMSDVVNNVCSEYVLDVVKEFTTTLIEDMRETRYDADGDVAFRLIVEGYSDEDIANMKFEIYDVSADINEGLRAEVIREYNSKEVSLEEVQKLLNNITLPEQSSVTRAVEGLKIEEKYYTEDEEVIEYAKEYEPLDCDCDCECTHEITWSYDYSRPVGVRIVEREYTENYLVLDLIEKDEDDELFM